MASSTDLIKAVSDCFGLSEVLVGSYYRYLRESGLVSRGGRGRNAAKMTEYDASSLIIAAACGSIVRENAAKTVQEYGELKSAFRSKEFEVVDREDLPLKFQEEHQSIDENGCWNLPGSEAAGMKELHAHHRLHDALGALIKVVRAVPRFEIEVSFSGPFPAARIDAVTPRFAHRPQFRESVTYYRSEWIHEIKRNLGPAGGVQNKILKHYKQNDLTLHSSFSYTTVKRISDLVETTDT